jgi:tRNA(Arg) A34 adenosine deaminase TadA
VANSKQTGKLTDLSLTLTLPDWVSAELQSLPPTLPTLEERMAAVIRFARLNVDYDTGGPFAAGVFERDSGKLIVIGVNRVMPHNCSSAHAEVMALSFAQKQLGTFDLGGEGLPAHQLVVNWRPCAMCYGATIWSGVRSLVVAGDGPELEEITGFDEGPVHPDWVVEMEKRGISVVQDVLRDEAIAGFHAFAKANRIVYNGRLGDLT